jgi:hypothetical protein
MQAQVQVFLGGLGTVGWFNRDIDACWLRIKEWPAARQLPSSSTFRRAVTFAAPLGNSTIMVCCLFQSLFQFLSHLPGDDEMICARSVIAKSCQFVSTTAVFLALCALHFSHLFQSRSVAVDE